MSKNKKNRVFVKVPAIDMSIGDDKRYMLMFTRDIFQNMIELGFSLEDSFYDRKTGKGYQRDPKDFDKHTLEICRVVSAGIPIDTAGQLNIDPADGPIEFTPLKENPILGTVTLYVDQPIGQVDCRHRIKGMLRAMCEMKECEFEIKWPAMLTNRTDLQCKRSFSMTNGTAAPIHKNLLTWQKAEFAREYSKEELKQLPKKLRERSTKLPEATKVVEQINDSNTGLYAGNILYQRIALPNEPVPERHSIVAGHRLAEYIRSALINRSGNFPEGDDVGVVYSNMFVAWGNLIPRAVDNYEWFTFREHCGSIMICELAVKLMSLPALRGRVPSAREFEVLLKKAIPECTEAYWNPHNALGQNAGKRIHGIDAAMGLAAEIAYKIDPTHFSKPHTH